MILEKRITINSVMLNTSPRFRKQTLQFLPECLVEISNSKNFNYSGQKLKSAYLIDIVHNMLLKYYFKKENIFTLSSVILKDKYGHLYNYYINFLKEKELIFLKKNYFAGKNSRMYALSPKILSGKILRYENCDKFLIRKYISKHLQFELDKHNLISKPIKLKLIEDLHKVSVEFERAIFYLDSLKNEDLDIYNRNKYSVESINKNHIFYHFDSYGRMHTNFTILKSFVRKNCLLIDGEPTCELDIKNSQPLFLSKLILDTNTSWVKEDEFRLFTTLVQNGNFYQYLIDNLHLENKSEAKKLTYKVLFGQNRPNSKMDQKFLGLFPTIHNFIKLYKKDMGDYKVLSHELQRQESNLIFNTIIRRLSLDHPEISVITVHDSIILPLKYKEIVSQIFFTEINRHFVTNTSKMVNI
jgi:hypothetical protein